MRVGGVLMPELLDLDHTWGLDLASWLVLGLVLGRVRVSAMKSRNAEDCLRFRRFYFRFLELCHKANIVARSIKTARVLIVQHSFQRQTG